MPLPLHHRSPRGVLSSSGWEREPSLVPSFASFMLGAQGWGHHPTELSTGQCFASGRALSIASRQHPGMDGWGGGDPTKPAAVARSRGDLPAPCRRRKGASGSRELRSSLQSGKRGGK